MHATYERLNLHVGATASEVIRAVRSILAPTAFQRCHRSARHKLYRTMLRHHRDARELFRFVSTGYQAPKRRKKKQA